MDLKHLPLNLPLGKTKNLAEGRVIYSFEKDQHAKLLLKNLAKMQADGVQTDVIIQTKSKDREEWFHSMLLAACSLFFKEGLTGKLFDCTAGNIQLDDLTPSQLGAFRDFLYKCELPIDEGMVDALKRFASKYRIDSLAQLCGLSKDQREGQEGNTIWSKQLENLLSQLHDMYQKSELTTTFLEDSEGSTQFTVHSPLMAAASGQLKDILSNPLFAQGNKYRLKVTANTLGDLIDYIYTGDVLLESENVADLLHAACIYEVPALANACCTWLSSELDSYNVIGIWWLARKADSDYTNDLENEARSFIIAHFKSVCQEGEFEELEYEDLKEIIQDDNLCVNGEEDVFFAVVNWVMADEEGRSFYFCDLLHCVRLEDTSVAFLRDVEEHPLVKNCVRCLEAILGARAKLQTPRVEQRAFEGIEIGDIERRSILEDEPRRYFDKEVLDSLSDISSITQTCDSDDNVKKVNKWTPHRGLKKNGEPDMRLRGNRQRLGNRNKDGSPDMRLKFNKEESEKKATNSKTKKGLLNTQETERPLKKDGTPDMRFKVNKEAVIQSSPQKTTKASQAKRGPLKKDGTPDRRFAVNKTPTAESSLTGSIPGPVKRDGTPDMRYAVNRAASPGAVSQSSTLGGPVKKDGTPDMRYSANKPSSGHSSLSSGYSSGGSISSFSESVLRSGPGGRLKRDGTPDMRFAVNKLTYGSPSLSGSSSSLCSSRSSSTGSSYSTSSYSSSSPSTRSSDSSSCYSSGSSYSGSSCGGSRSASGPLKRDGTPDMRYAANKSSYGSSSAYSGTGYSSGSSSYGSSYGGSSSCGPLKRDGTPDMRYAANKSSYGSSSAYSGTGYSSGSSSYGSRYGGSSSCGPLKRDGTPDMRYAVNRRK